MTPDPDIRAAPEAPAAGGCAARTRSSALRLALLLGLVLGSGRVEGTHAANGDANGPSETQQREYQIKAAFLLHFIRYTTWPEGSFEGEKSRIVVTVVGDDPFGSTLEATFGGEDVNGRKIEVRRSKELPERLGGHVVFCADLEESARVELLKQCRKRPVLLIGERPGFAESGACINFFISELKTRFEVNTDALTEGSLVVSPAVLKLAKIVKTRREEGAGR